MQSSMTKWSARRFSTIYPRADWPHFFHFFLSILMHHVATLILACSLRTLPAFLIDWYPNERYRSDRWPNENDDGSINRETNSDTSQTTVSSVRVLSLLFFNSLDASRFHLLYFICSVDTNRPRLIDFLRLIQSW